MPPEGLELCDFSREAFEARETERTCHYSLVRWSFDDEGGVQAQRVQLQAPTPLLPMFVTLPPNTGVSLVTEQLGSEVLLAKYPYPTTD